MSIADPDAVFEELQRGVEEILVEDELKERLRSGRPLRVKTGDRPRFAYRPYGAGQQDAPVSNVWS